MSAKPGLGVLQLPTEACLNSPYSFSFASLPGSFFRELKLSLAFSNSLDKLDIPMFEIFVF